MSYANTFLTVQIAGNEFSTNTQFMLTTGLQVDDMAWIAGQTQTVYYSSNYGSFTSQYASLNYTFEVTSDGVHWTTVCSNVTSMLMYQMPISYYSEGNNYFERLIPTSSGSFLQQGASAPAYNVFCIENTSMAQGNYIQTVVVPTIRVIDSSITSQQESTSYLKFYLPLLNSSESDYYSKSLTLTGNGITQYTVTNATELEIIVQYPNFSQGFGSSFFNFNSSTIFLNSSTSPSVFPNSTLEIYLGQVIFSVGQV